MKQWIIVDDRTNSRSAIFEEIIKANSQQQAIDIAKRTWDALADADKKKCDAYYVGFVNIDDDGCIDYNTMIDMYTIK